VEQPPIDAAAICQIFDIGDSLSPPIAVTGGLSNRMWRLETSCGVYAVKELNPNWTGVDYHARMERAFGVEMAAYDAGVAMPRPIPVAANGRCLADLSAGGRDYTVRVHEWVDARPLQHVVYPGDFPSRVGETIARIHALKLDAEVTLADALHAFGHEHWESLAERVERSDVSWAWQFRWLLGPIADLEAYGVRSRSNPDALLLSHRDADQKNWMETGDGELLLADWDAAGPVHPRHEIASLALVWGGVGLGEPDRRAASSLIEGYRRAGGVFDARDGDLDEFALVTVGWFEFNVRRAIGEGARDDADRATGDALVRRGFKDLPRYARSVERWLTMLRAL
jgi:hypothetical protein